MKTITVNKIGKVIRRVILTLLILALTFVPFNILKANEGFQSVEVNGGKLIINRDIVNSTDAKLLLVKKLEESSLNKLSPSNALNDVVTFHFNGIGENPYGNGDLVAQFVNTVYQDSEYLAQRKFYGFIQGY